MVVTMVMACGLKCSMFGCLGFSMAFAYSAGAYWISVELIVLVFIMAKVVSPFMGVFIPFLALVLS